MKYKQYLTEGSAQAIVDKLEEDCKPFINDLKKANLKHELLYRGSKKGYTFTKVFVKQDRVSRDSPKQLQEKTDELFKDKFGLELRSKTLFTTGNLGEATNYGKAYIVFPIGKYEIYWSPKIDDLYEKINTRNIIINQTTDGKLNPDKRMRISMMDFYRELPQEMNGEERRLQQHLADDILNKMINTYKKGDLKSAMRSKNEIMVYCRSAYMVHPEYGDAIMDYFEYGSIKDRNK